jgi:membrane-associated protease RseP (regulator of RpoE activity)
MRSRATSPYRAIKAAFSSMSTKTKRLLSLVAVALLLAGAFVPGLDAVAGLERNLLIFTVILTISVGLHEFGHLLMARLLHLRVHSYGLFMGPRVASRLKFGIEWRLNILPIGGYVTLQGENRDEGPGSFYTAPAWKKVLVYVVGSLVNLVLAYVALIAIAAPVYWSMFSGNLIKTIQASWIFANFMVGTIASSTAAAFAGFLPHAATRPLDSPFLGVPGMVRASGLFAAQGIEGLLLFFAAINLSLFLVNLLPIPPLDGGQTVLAILRRLMGRLVTEQVAHGIAAVGLGALIVFIVFVNGVDVVRMLSGVPFDQ